MQKLTTNHLLHISLIFFSALAPETGNALSLTFVPRVQAGVMDYAFEQAPVDVTFEPKENVTLRVQNPGKKLSSTMPLLSSGVTAFIDSFFIDLYLQKAFSGSDSRIETHDFGSSNRKSLVDSNFDRNEQSISIGYGVGKNWAVYGGYRKSTTNIKDQKSLSTEHFNNNNELTKITTSKALGDLDFNQNGYFLGGTYALAIGQKSAVSLNLAVAYLDGKRFSSFKVISSESVYPDGREEVDSIPDTNANYIPPRFEGDTIGLNLGVTWKGQIQNKLGYSLGLNAYKYDFDGTEANTFSTSDKPDEVTLLEVEQTISETVLRFSGGLSYEF